MNKTILYLTIIFGILISLNSCSFEDEIDLPQAELTVYNQSSQVVEIFYRNVDTGMDETTASFINPGLARTIPLDIGYEFEIIAKVIPENTVFTKNFEIKPHQNYEWQFTGK